MTADQVRRRLALLGELRKAKGRAHGRGHLVPQQRTVIRMGKQVQTTVWVSPGEAGPTAEGEAKPAEKKTGADKPQASPVWEGPAKGSAQWWVRLRHEWDYSGLGPRVAAVLGKVGGASAEDYDAAEGRVMEKWYAAYDEEEPKKADPVAMRAARAEAKRLAKPAPKKDKFAEWQKASDKAWPTVDRVARDHGLGKEERGRFHTELSNAIMEGKPTGPIVGKYIPKNPAVRHRY